MPRPRPISEDNLRLIEKLLDSADEDSTAAVAFAVMLRIGVIGDRVSSKLGRKIQAAGDEFWGPLSDAESIILKAFCIAVGSS